MLRLVPAHGTPPQHPAHCQGAPHGSRRVVARPSSMAAAAEAARGEAAEERRFALAVHGGAGVINDTNTVWLEDARQGLVASLKAGRAVLAAGGSAMDAAVAAVAAMEADPHFNAGVGSVLTASGTHELEASVMGSDGRCGAVALLKRIAHPITLAQQVMERTPHIFLSGERAEEFAVQHGHDLVDTAAFTTEQRRQQWLRYRDEAQLAPADEIVQRRAHHAGQQPGQHDQTGTVGAVAIDSAGRLAAATSTGGRTNKWDGRIGDTPMIGAGTWADARCAVSGTGVGEEFIRRAAAHDVAARVAYKRISLQAAIQEVVWESMAVGDGGFVGVADDYSVAWDFNSGGMYRGMVDHTGRLVTAIFPAEEDRDSGLQPTGVRPG